MSGVENTSIPTKPYRHRPMPKDTNTAPESRLCLIPNECGARPDGSIAGVA